MGRFSNFKLALKIYIDGASSVWNLSKQSNTDKLMRDCTFGDNVSMRHANSIVALVKTNIINVSEVCHHPRVSH